MCLEKHKIKKHILHLIEEMGEVMQAFSHVSRGRCKTEHLCNELVDLQFAITVVRKYYMTDEIWDKKLKNLEEKTKKEMEKGGLTLFF